MTDGGQKSRRAVVQRGDGAIVDRDAAKRALERLDPRSIAAKLRPLMSEIDQKVSEGVRYADIVEALKEGGIEVSLETFRKYLHRYRKAQNRDMPARWSDGGGDSTGIREAETQATPDSSDDMVKPSLPPDDGRVRAMLDPKARDEFAEEFFESPTLRWLREKEAKDQKK